MRQRYAVGFRSWEADGYKPLRVPECFVTEPVDQTEFRIAGKVWVFGIARVAPAGDGWLEWTPFVVQ